MSFQKWWKFQQVIFILAIPWKKSSMDYIKHITLNQDLIITGFWKGDNPRL